MPLPYSISDNYPSSNDPNFDFSVIVPVHNSERYIEETLTHIKAAAKNFRIELIIIDDSSTDGTRVIAEKYADRVITIPKASNRLRVRLAGFKVAQAQYIVNIDSDILVPIDAFDILRSFWDKTHDATAVSAMLSTNIEHLGFFSVYKHLYMNYIYRRTPNRVTFLYGSLFSIRNNPSIIAELEKLSQKMYAVVTDDTEAGLFLSSTGHKLYLSHELNVTHLKKFGFLSLLKNDFDVPRDFGRLWGRYGSPKQITEYGGFTHVSYLQLFSLFFSVLLLFALFTSPMLVLYLLIGWGLSNLSFAFFLWQHMNFRFFMLTVPLLFIDNVIMFFGTGVGIVEGYALKSSSS